MNDAKIEEVSLLDFDEIDEVEQEVFTHPFPKSIFINDFNNNRFSCYYKLSVDQHIIGYIALWIIYNDCQIISIGVKKNYQRQGYGEQLMNFIIQLVKDKECDNITLEVRVSNEKAISMYQKFGFYKLSLRKRYYEDGEDAYLMKLDI